MAHGLMGCEPMDGYFVVQGGAILVKPVRSIVHPLALNVRVCSVTGEKVKFQDFWAGFLIFEL